jgi:hypothetical protein
MMGKTKLKATKKSYVQTFDTVIQGKCGKRGGTGKFLNLARIAGEFDVPRAICITAEFFHESLAAQPKILHFLQDFFAELQSTSGCFLLDKMPELDRCLAELTLPDRLSRELKHSVEEAFGACSDTVFAVRSSAHNEDTESSSFAGIYESVLNVKGIDELAESFIRVWKSYYCYPAIVARIRRSDYSMSPRLDVIIQLMVDARYSGVAFSRSPSGKRRGAIEYTVGSGDRLVSGVSDVQTYETGTGDASDALMEDLNGQVLRTVKKLKLFFGCEVDVEWAWDGNFLYVLQVRPITSLGTRHIRRRTVLDLYDLYLDDQAGNLDLGNCREVYDLYVNKRSLPYRLADNHNVATGAGFVLNFNLAGIEDHFGIMEDALHASTIPNVIVDIDKAIRQTIIAKSELKRYLTRTFQNYDKHEIHSVIIREYVTGECGFITQLIAKDRLLLEASQEGLMAINRGIAECMDSIIEQREIEEGKSWIFTASSNSTKPITCKKRAMQKIFLFTSLMNEYYPEVKLEWVLMGGCPYFIDFTPHGESCEYLLASNNGNRVIHTGNASGPILKLDDKDYLVKLSICPEVSVSGTKNTSADYSPIYEFVSSIKKSETPPIIVCQRPYAILSYVLDHVAGFVFSGGGLLCHLAILIRESNKPAIICKNVDDIIRSKNKIIISHNTVVAVNE